MNITRKNVICYTVLPQFLPRIKALFASGFQYVPYFLALVYGAVRLLPAQHPYLSPSNMGKFGLRHVVAAAAHNLTWSWRHIDQIILFVLVLVGLAMAAMQMVLLLMAIMAGSVMAAPPATPATPFAALFDLGTHSPAQDIAFMMLDMVFGVPDIFNSCVSTGGNCLNSKALTIESSEAGVSWGMQPISNFPTAMHVGLHQMFQIYSIGLLVIAAFIFMYFIITILAETMQSGTPFGKRYNHVWAPIRMVVAFGLLVPVGYGLNTSQYIVLHAAKLGSNFATNGWVLFNESLNTAYGGGYKNILPGADASGGSMIAVPEIPDLSALVQFMYVARTCAYGEDLAGSIPVDSASQNPTAASNSNVQMWMVRDPTAVPPAQVIGYLGHASSDYAALVNFANGASSVKIRFGRYNEKAGSGKYEGFVAPICGELTFPLSDSRPLADQEKGVRLLQEVYYDLIKHLWHGAASEATVDYVTRFFPHNNQDTTLDPPDEALISGYLDYYAGLIQTALNTTAADTALSVSVPAGGAAQLMQESGRWSIQQPLMDKGWAGAAIWYNRVAEMNGAMSTALLNIPQPLRYPFIMEHVHDEKRKGDGVVDIKTRFQPTGHEAMARPNDEALAKIYWVSYNFWQDSGILEGPHARPSGNAAIDILNALIGTNGLFSMRDNENIHPLAQLSGVGKALIEASIRNLTNVAAGGLSGAFLAQINQFAGVTTANFTQFLLKFTMITISAGFVLFYVVPFLPFIYFAFAFGGWVKGIFEAMVGAPLWALAHMRIDGQGLSGQAALSGYFLIFEIFLRPILMIFGLIASISTFAALVSVLNLVFDQVVSNVGGFDVETELNNGIASKLADMRGVIDQFFFTVMYVIVVYLMGMSSFKLIDNIPNQILRWMGQSVTTFNDSRENAAESLVGRATQGAQQTSSAVGGGLGQLANLGAK